MFSVLEKATLSTCPSSSISTKSLYPSSTEEPWCPALVMVLLAQLMMMVSSSAQHTREMMPRRLLLFFPGLFLLLPF